MTKLLASLALAFASALDALFGTPAAGAPPPAAGGSSKPPGTIPPSTPPDRMPSYPGDPVGIIKTGLGLATGAVGVGKAVGSGITAIQGAGGGGVEAAAGTAGGEAAGAAGVGGLATAGLLAGGAVVTAYGADKVIGAIGIPAGGAAIAIGGLPITGTAAVVGAIGDAFSGLFGGGDPPPKAPPVGANGDGGVTAGPLGSDPRSNVDPSTLSVPIWAWQPAEWDSSVSYGQGDAVLRNGAWFKSTGNSNRGHDPANGQTDGQYGYNAGPPWWGLYVAQRAP